MTTMADNYIENQYNDFIKRQARKEQERRRRLHKAMEEYRNRLKNEKRGK